MRMNHKLACLTLAVFLPGSLAPGCAKSDEDASPRKQESASAPVGDAVEHDSGPAQATSPSPHKRAVKSYDPRLVTPPSIEPAAEPTPRQMIALPPIPIPKKELEPVPLTLPDRKIPTYPDGAWLFLASSESFGLPLGLRKIEPGSKMQRDHVEIRVEAGRIRSLHQLDSSGRLVWVRDFLYEEGDLFPRGFAQKDEHGTLTALGQFLDNATRYRLTTPSGASLLEGCAEWKRELTASGFVHLQTCLSRNQTPIPDRNGVVTVQFERQEMGLVTQRLNLGPDGRLTLDASGVALTEYQYNLDGNIIEMAFLNLEKKPVKHNKYGCARIDFSWTSSGQLAAEKYYGIHDEPVAGSLGIYGIQYAYDATGRKIEEVTFGIGGSQKPPTRAKASRLVWDYDQEGRVVRTASYAPDGTPAPRATGFHMEKFEFPSANEEIITCLGTNLHPVACGHATPAVKRERGPDGHIVAETYLDGQGQVVAPKGSLGIAATSHEWDPQGRLRRTVWSDKRLQPLKTLGGPTAMSFDYNDFGDVVLRSFEDGQGAASDASWGYASVRVTYDDWGRVSQACVYSAVGTPVVAKKPGAPFQGFHCLRYEYQGTWNPARIRFLDSLSAPIAVTWANTGLVSHQADLEWNAEGQLVRIIPAQPLPPPEPPQIGNPDLANPPQAGSKPLPPNPAAKPLPVVLPGAAGSPGQGVEVPPLLPPAPLECLQIPCPSVTDLQAVFWL